VPTGVQGELIIILPEDATNIRIARTSLEIVDVFEARRMVDASNNYIDASLKVTERGAHKEVSFNPFKGGMVFRPGMIDALSTVEFTLPSFTTSRNGFGSWDFEIPAIRGFPHFSPGVGSAEFDPGSSPRSGSHRKPNLAERESGFVVRMCRKDAPLQAEFLDPPPVARSVFEWLAPFGDDWQLTGEISGGKLRKMVDASLTVSIAILGALLGALYGIALTKNRDEYKLGRDESASSILRGRARQEDQLKSRVERPVGRSRKGSGKGSKSSSKRRRR
jgi:hypothetical protein